ncbi:MAG: DMT family transporter [Alphaproteobacteria bacterium]|nr:DMT family transporter [Alphaproteobacteria bacterium]
MLDFIRKQVTASGGLGGGSGGGHNPIMGALWVLAAMTFLAVLITISRFAALEGMDPLQLAFFRNAFCVMWMLPLFWWRGLSLVRTRNLRLYSVRVALSFVAITAMFHAAALIPIGEITAISFLSPLFGTVFAILLLGERVRYRRWLALGIGFFGAMVILRPTMATLGAGQMAALVAALAVGVIGPLVRRLTREDDADRVVFVTNLMLTPLSLVPALMVWEWPPVWLWPYLVAMGLAAVLGHMALVRGYSVAEASLVMTLKFVRLPIVVVLGYVAFGELIDGWTWVGALIIFAASAYITRREAAISQDPGKPADEVRPL